MKYTELNDMWKKQELLAADWRNAIFEEAFKLRETVATAIDAPDSWTSPDGRTRRRYIEVIDISTTDCLRLRTNHDDAITDNGDLVFGLSFTFERQPSSFPKDLSHIAIAVRFHEKSAQFCLWDRSRGSIRNDAVWTNDQQFFISQLLTELTDFLSYDPKDGQSEKRKIGFGAG